MTLRAPRTAVLLGLAALLLLLSGCYRIEGEFVVSEEGTVSGSILYAFDERALADQDTSVEDVVPPEDEVFDGVDTTSEDYAEDGFVGRRYTFQDVPLADFNDSSSDDSATDDDIVVERTADGGYTIEGSVDLSGDTTALFPDADADAYGEPTFRLTFELPGTVTSSTGEIDGRRVTFDVALGERTELRAESDPPAGFLGTYGIWLGVAAAVLVVGAVLVVLLLRRRRRAGGPPPGGPWDGGQSWGPPPGSGWGGAPGPGAAQPQAWGPPPGAAPPWGPQGGYPGPPSAGGWPGR